MCSVKGMSFRIQSVLMLALSCSLRPAQPGVKDWKERISIRNMSQDIMGSDRKTGATGVVELSDENTHLLASSLCYSCHTTLTSRSSRTARRVASIGGAIHNVPLPTWASNNLCEKLDVDGMKEQIQEFLICTDVADNKSNI